MLEQLRPPPDPELPAPSTGSRGRFGSHFDQGALITNVVGFGLAVVCGFVAWIAGPDPAFVITLLIFGWLVALVSLLASEVAFKLPVLVLAGLAFGSEGVVLTEHSHLPPRPIELSNGDLKLYVNFFAQRLRGSAIQFKSKFDDIDRGFRNTGVSQEESDRAARDSEDYKKLFLEETTEFKDQYLVQARMLQDDLLKRLGPKFPEALFPSGDSRRESIEASRLMLADGALVGSDPISHIADYLEALANSLP
jgi:hypothetical protein